MNRSIKGWVILIVVASVASTLIFQSWRKIQAQKKVFSATHFLPEKLIGKMRKNQAGGNRQTILCFMSIDCDHCHNMATELGAKAAEIPDVSVILFTDALESAAKRFVFDCGLYCFNDLTIIYDTLGFWRELFAIRQMPAIYIYDHHKEIKNVFVGEVGIDRILKELK